MLRNFFSRFIPQPQISLEQQLENLAACGIRLKPQFSAATLLEEFSRERYEQRPYIGVIIAMAGENKDGAPISDNLFHLDTETFDSAGAYVHVAERLRALANSDLPIESIEDHFDRANGDAWIAFDLRGERIEWHARVKENWIDPEILANFCALLKAQNGARRYTYCDLKGSNCIIGCATEDELRRLRKMTGMNFTWLE